MISGKPYLFSLIIVCGLSACKSLKETPQPALKPIPETFAFNKDSASSASMSWRTYFSDSLLLKLIDESIQNNPDVLIALQKIEVAKSGVQFAKGALFPTISANTSFLQRRFGLYTMDGAGNISTFIRPEQIVPIQLPDFYLGLQTTWEIDVWGKLRNKRKSALARYVAGIEGKNMVLTNLVAQLANAYYELLALDNELDIIRETIVIQQQALDLVTIQKQAAAANELAVMQFKSQLLNSQALEFETLQRITEFENKINFFLGRFPQSVTRNKVRFNNPITFKTSAGIPSQLLANRPDIKQAELELVAAKADMKAAKAAFYPSLNLSGFAGLQAFQAGLLFQTPESVAYSMLANLASPLINRSAIKASFKSASAVQVEALYNYQKIILTAYIEVSNESARINNLEKIVALKTEQVTVLNSAVEVSSELFRTNRANYLEVLMTQRSTLETRLQLVTLKLRQCNASIDIYKALGGGWR